MPIKPKKVLKIIAGVLIFFTLPTLLLFGYMHIKYNEDLPFGKQGLDADKLAIRMLDALNYEAYKASREICWLFCILNRENLATIETLHLKSANLIS